MPLIKATKPGVPGADGPAGPAGNDGADGNNNNWPNTLTGDGIVLYYDPSDGTTVDRVYVPESGDIDAAFAAATGWQREIMLGPGTFSPTSPLFLDDGTRVIGCGEATIVDASAFAASQDSIFKVNTWDGSSIENLVINMGANSTRGIYITGNGTNYLTLRNLRITNVASGQYGIDGDPTGTNFLHHYSNVRITGADGTGMRLDNIDLSAFTGMYAAISSGTDLEMTNCSGIDISMIAGSDTTAIDIDNTNDYFAYNFAVTGGGSYTNAATNSAGNKAP